MIRLLWCDERWPAAPAIVATQPVREISSLQCAFVIYRVSGEGSIATAPVPVDTNRACVRIGAIGSRVDIVAGAFGPVRKWFVHLEILASRFIDSVRRHSVAGKRHSLPGGIEVQRIEDHAAAGEVSGTGCRIRHEMRDELANCPRSPSYVPKKYVDCASGPPRLAPNWFWRKMPRGQFRDLEKTACVSGFVSQEFKRIAMKLI